MNELVIARYSEDLSWIVAVPENFRITIYNKGDPIAQKSVLARADRVLARENEGRESETFLYHMSVAAGDPGATTVFTQGDPFEHSPDFLALLARCDHWHPVQALSCRWKDHLPPPRIQDTATSDNIDGLRVRRELFSLANWGPLHFMDSGALRTGLHYWARFSQPEGMNMAAHFFRLCGLVELAERASAHLLGQFAYGAVFAARNDRILSLPPDSLLLMRHLTTGPTMFGYVMERLWLHLLGMDFLLPATADIPAFAALQHPAAKLTVG